LEKSKTGKKGLKKKESKSMENIKVFKERNQYLQGTRKVSVGNTNSNQYEIKIKEKSPSTSK
jgi:hypothetical protein